MHPGRCDLRRSRHARLGGGGRRRATPGAHRRVGEAACPTCGVLAVSHGRRVRMLHDMPCFGRVTLLRWLLRIWRCREPQCATQTLSEAHGLAPPRMALTVRAVGWAADALSYDDTTVSALARHLGVDWHRPVNTRPQGRPRRRRACDSTLRRGQSLGGWVDDHLVAEAFELGNQTSGVGLDRFGGGASRRPGRGRARRV